MPQNGLDCLNCLAFSGYFFAEVIQLCLLCIGRGVTGGFYCTLNLCQLGFALLKLLATLLKGFNRFGSLFLLSVPTVAQSLAT